MRAPGLATDAFARATISEERREAGFTVVETPSRRNFWFGNCLILDVAPAPAEYDRWLDRHAEIFAGTGVQRRVVQWEASGERRDPPRPVRAGIEFEVSTVFVSDATPAPAPRDDVAIRELAGDDDWSRVAELERNDSKDQPPGFLEFYAWRTHMLRLDTERGRARLFGAFTDDGELAALAGAYACDGWIRLTTPITAGAYRRRGLFSALFACSVREARGRFPAARIVVVAQADSAPERLYRSLGFEAHGYQYALVE